MGASAGQRQATMGDEWPFDEPRNLTTITTRRVVHEGRPSLLAAHHENDGAWTFMDRAPFVVEDALVIGLANMVGRDPTLRHLADPPPGWEAWREAPHLPWQRRRAPSEA